MTELVRSQLNIFFVMTAGGMAAGLVLYVFRTFARMRRLGKVMAAVVEISAWIGTGFMLSEFFYYCDNGKVSFEGIASIIAGLLLWKKFFCGILESVGGYYGKEKNG